MSLPVLIVDKEPQIRSLIRTVLSKHGFPILEAPDGTSALSTVKYLNGAATVIVSGFSLPGLDGAALARLVKAQFPTTPILLMSSEATPCDCLCSDAFLAKPFLPSELVNTVRRLHETHLQSGEQRCD